MDVLRAIGQWLWTSHVDWELVLRFIEVLIWPTITLAGLAMLRPGRLIDAIMDGGEISAGPATLKFRKKLEEVTETVSSAEAEDDPEPTEAGTQETPAVAVPSDEDPYTTIMKGWDLMIDSLEESAKLAGLPPLKRARPLDTLKALYDLRLVERRHQRGVEELFELRNSAKTLGSAKVERRGLFDEARKFYENADTMGRSIKRTVRRRVGRPPQSPDSGQSALH